MCIACTCTNCMYFIKFLIWIPSKPPTNKYCIIMLLSVAVWCVIIVWIGLVSIPTQKLTMDFKSNMDIYERKIFELTVWKATCYCRICIDCIITSHHIGYGDFLKTVLVISQSINIVVIKPLTCGDRVNSVYLGQYHGCWCPGSLRRQDIIISHDIDYAEYICPGLTRGRNSSICVKSMWNDVKCKYKFMFPLKNLPRKGLGNESMLVYPCEIN